MCQWLVGDCGVPVDRAEIEVGQTALFRAVIGGHCDVAEYLVSNRVAASGFVGFDGAGRCALSYAVQHGHVDVIRLVYRLGRAADAVASAADEASAAWARDVDGTSPLHWAVESENLEMARLLLLEFGEDAFATDWDGVSPIGRATELGNTDMVALLAAHGDASVAAVPPEQAAADPSPQVPPEMDRSVDGESSCRADRVGSDGTAVDDVVVVVSAGRPGDGMTDAEADDELTDSDGDSTISSRSGPAHAGKRSVAAAGEVDEAGESSSSGGIKCRICWQTKEEKDEDLISPCRCAGSMAYAHRSCLVVHEGYRAVEARGKCGVCGEAYGAEWNIRAAVEPRTRAGVQRPPLMRARANSRAVVPEEPEGEVTFWARIYVTRSFQFASGLTGYSLPLYMWLTSLLSQIGRDRLDIRCAGEESRWAIPGGIPTATFIIVLLATLILLVHVRASMGRLPQSTQLQWKNRRHTRMFVGIYGLMAALLAMTTPRTTYVIALVAIALTTASLAISSFRMSPSSTLFFHTRITAYLPLVVFICTSYFTWPMTSMVRGNFTRDLSLECDDVTGTRRKVDISFPVDALQSVTILSVHGIEYIYRAVMTFVVANHRLQRRSIDTIDAKFFLLVFFLSCIRDVGSAVMMHVYSADPIFIFPAAYYISIAINAIFLVGCCIDYRMAVLRRRERRRQRRARRALRESRRGRTDRDRAIVRHIAYHR